MRRLFALLVSISVAVSSAETLYPMSAGPVVKTEMKVTNLAFDFATFWSRTDAQPIENRVTEFKREIGSRFPAFYGVTRYGGERTQAEQDAVIRRAIEEFPEIRERYGERLKHFSSDLPKAVASFVKVFPDFRPSVPVYVLHSLGEADGGQRTLLGNNVLFFGIDSMVRLHKGSNDTPFFHHELFHTYHTPKLESCAGGPMWAYLWIEGLATYVSKALNPDATEAELLLDIPQGALTHFRDSLDDSLVQFEHVADSTERSDYRDLFTRAGTGALPGRRGYYLGYLVATEAARTRDLHTLASLNCNQVRELVFSTVKSLRTALPKSP